MRRAAVSSASISSRRMPAALENVATSRLTLEQVGVAGDGPEPVPTGVVLGPPADRVVAPQPQERGVRDAGGVRVGVGDVGVGGPEIPVRGGPAHRDRGAADAAMIVRSPNVGT